MSENRTSENRTSEICRSQGHGVLDKTWTKLSFLLSIVIHLATYSNVYVLFMVDIDKEDCF